jgi:uncharacterized protein
MDIPYNKLGTEVLDGILRDFVLREGTDYGHQEYSLLSKIEQVKKQLERGQVKIVFDDQSETCNIVAVK